MSIKTLRKRIALVAVSALTAGVLSVASTPAANALSTVAITAPNIHMVAASDAGTAGAIGQCAIAATALGADITTVNSTGTVLAVGASIGFDTTTNGTGNLTITGPATFTIGAGATQTISQDAKGVGFADNINNVGLLTVTGAGDIVVTAKNSATITSGTAVKTFSIAGVTSCAASTTPVNANSSLTLQTAVDQNEGTTGDDVYTSAEKAYGTTSIIAVVLRNAYKANVATGVITAEATGNALVAFDGAAALGATAFTSSNAAATGVDLDVLVSQNTTVAPGAALTTTVTVKYNGVAVGSKTLTINGLPSSMVVDEVTVGTSASTGTFRYLVKDNAGNNLDSAVTPLPAFGSFTAAAAGFVSAGIVTAAAGTVNQTGSTKGTGTFNCVAAGTGTSGSQSVTLGVQIGTALLKSNAFTATCGDSEVRSFTASTDKAVYSPGEIATVTLNALDRNGLTVGNAAVVGAAFSQISIPGMTIIGAAISSGDTFTSGAKTYKFRVDQAEGSFVAQAQVTVGSSAVSAEKVVKTMLYTIKSSATTVSNADVLKSIVALIASINKQIQALQKLILKR